MTVTMGIITTMFCSVALLVLWIYLQSKHRGRVLLSKLNKLLADGAVCKEDVQVAAKHQLRRYVADMDVPSSVALTGADCIVFLWAASCGLRRVTVVKAGPRGVAIHTSQQIDSDRP